MSGSSELDRDVDSRGEIRVFELQNGDGSKPFFDSEKNRWGLDFWPESVTDGAERVGESLLGVRMRGGLRGAGLPYTLPGLHDNSATRTCAVGMPHTERAATERKRKCRNGIKDGAHVWILYDSFVSLTHVALIRISRPGDSFAPANCRTALYASCEIAPRGGRLA